MYFLDYGVSSFIRRQIQNNSNLNNLEGFLFFFLSVRFWVETPRFCGGSLDPRGLSMPSCSLPLWDFHLFPGWLHWMLSWCFQSSGQEERQREGEDRWILFKALFNFTSNHKSQIGQKFHIEHLTASSSVSGF